MKILLADDDQSLRRVLQFKLEKQGYYVTPVVDGEEALDKISVGQFDLLLSDIKMPKLGGIELLEQVVKLQPGLKVILMTAHATVNQAVEAVKLGAFDYITKPFEDEELFISIEKALAFEKLESENKELKSKLKRVSRQTKLIGISPLFKEMQAMVSKVAESDATVLITGESGTGKELVARTLHEKSVRAEGALVVVNCAAIPRDLLESELFGHTRGSFTGAVKDKKGKFELASGGTLFLDEIAELAGDLQAKLLRVLQERVVEPIGSEQPIEVDVRVIAATNVDLANQVDQGLFRNDLFYRLNVIPIRIPKLSERVEDIPILVSEFVKRFSGSESVTVSKALMNALVTHSWPGNVRELENLIERMVVLKKSKTLTPNDLPDDFLRPVFSNGSQLASEPNRSVTFHEAEEQLVRSALEQNGWNRTRAARHLDIPRHVLIYRMKKYNISELNN